MKVKLTKFQRYLAAEGACLGATQFVAAQGGSFTRAWKACDNMSWKSWLAMNLTGPCNTKEPRVNCPRCKITDASPAAQARFVMAQARKRGWVRA